MGIWYAALLPTGSVWKLPLLETVLLLLADTGESEYLWTCLWTFFFFFVAPPFFDLPGRSTPGIVQSTSTGPRSGKGGVKGSGGGGGGGTGPTSKLFPDLRTRGEAVNQGRPSVKGK